MTARRNGIATPGYGDRVKVISSTSGREWTGWVLVWGSTGAPFVQLDEDASRRWFPPSWVDDVFPGSGPPLCPCVQPDQDADGVDIRDPYCPDHGDPAAILRKACA